MNEQAARILTSLVSRYGSSIALDPLRCEGLLRDTCPRCHREIFVLVNAVRQQVPADLLAPRHSLPPALFRGFLVKRLQDELAFSDEAAHWAVDTWAAALGLEDNPGPQEQNPETRNSGTISTIPVPEAGPGTTTPEQRAGWAQELESATTEVRLAAIGAMAQSPDTATIQLLITGLENSSWETRAAAFDALVDLGDRAAACLVEALGDSHERVVMSAIIALGAIRARGAAEPLIALLEKGGRPVPCLIWALGEIGDTRAITPLARFLKSSNPQVRSGAELALKKFS